MAIRTLQSKLVAERRKPKPDRATIHALTEALQKEMEQLERDVHSDLCVVLGGNRPTPEQIIAEVQKRLAAEPAK